jgi:hypothetical protein
LPRPKFKEVVAKYIFGLVLEGIIGSFFGWGASDEQRATELILLEGDACFDAHAASPDLVLLPVVAGEALFVGASLIAALLEGIVGLLLLLSHVLQVVLVPSARVPPVGLIRHRFLYNFGRSLN